MKLTAKSWRKEFDKKFKGTYLNKGDGGYFVDVYIKDFISQLLKAVIKDVAGKKMTNGEAQKEWGYMGNTNNPWSDFAEFYNQHRQEVLERGKKWVK